MNWIFEAKARFELADEMRAFLTENLTSETWDVNHDAWEFLAKQASLELFYK